MPTGINRTAIRSYRLMDDDTGTVFQYKLPDTMLRNYLINKAAKNAQVMTGADARSQPQVMEYFEEVLRFCLTGWTDFKDEQNQPIEFASKKTHVTGVGERDAMNSTLFEYFAREWEVELASHIMDESNLSKEQEKNSAPPSA